MRLIAAFVAGAAFGILILGAYPFSVGRTSACADLYSVNQNEVSFEHGRCVVRTTPPLPPLEKKP